jgi:6-phosphogluconolactonase/glucosamine-6-phosphate isomerase/deaminase
MRPRVHRFDSQDELVDALYARIATLSAQYCARQGRFRIVLSGGTTPQALYRRLRTLATDWSCWQIYFGDERNLPIGDPDRNDSMAAAAWLDHVDLDGAQVHAVPYLADVEAAAAAYADTIANAQGFDLVLLGMGEDGHTASLFPGDERITSARQHEPAQPQRCGRGLVHCDRRRQAEAVAELVGRGNGAITGNSAAGRDRRIYRRGDKRMISFTHGMHRNHKGERR